MQFTSEAKEALSDNVDVFDEIRLAMLEVGRGLRNHLKKQKQKAKAQEKFELVNIILPEIHDKAISILEAEPVPLAPVITKIMNAVFLEDQVQWILRQKKPVPPFRCTITLQGRGLTLYFQPGLSEMGSSFLKMNGEDVEKPRGFGLGNWTHWVQESRRR